jgi:outer membrane protein assembly factor BamE (lipoprotein component of BamABCDE complex)
MNTNKPIVSIALALACAAICVSCYSTGHEVKTDNLKKLEAGVTTEQQAIELLGKPTGRGCRTKSLLLLISGAFVLEYV